ncbi:MAG TPA: CDP-diacylglycerol--glycerol-3-phosphate 3-phosphatidyltransferase [Lacipirellulaceae bacterium]|nr:CDP-diacylglycerol--glycerol-3-phosphate 3-phosphatidyltransferase [Lacipirellulaceae bacterium]
MDDHNATQTVAAPSPPVLNVVWNVPNTLTVARLVLAVFCFICLAIDWYLPALVLFAIAAGTDWVDGFYARRYGQITQLGRILDPFADKIIICGTFTFLAAVPPVDLVNGLNRSASEIWGWMAVIVIARELLVTLLRSFFEEHGTDFSAKWSGKWKMVLQCGCVALSLWRLWYYQFNAVHMSWGMEPSALSTWLLRLLVWAAVAMTIYSGWVYVRRALDLLRS